MSALCSAWFALTALLYLFVWGEPKVALYAAFAAIPWALLAIHEREQRKRERT